MKAYQPVVANSDPFQNVERRDAFGDPLVNVPILSGGSLVDIYKMLGEGKNIEQIAEHYACKKKVIEKFLLKHKNASVTICDPVIFTGDNVTRPRPRGGANRY